ncbi:hypothetical protein P153DRAFT_128879 [Dothidotthia symphoricarpi CBS 119687]|uniref:Uncharacterized protein n=1 Tax=Dothidotthia symphoricarpi CBS 119687 TaxID=1392245 RepID=A0A6A6A275_9PLEO|nr:uncharacterized protein P153DRAFT_128879 [Dothidotthia symphoricarpi CBS 119687]KAF2124838.1 hypothetical protein P153DRAFT_128879 [Dothidotthia symphoricarpi CBS 119687]
MSRSHTTKANAEHPGGLCASSGRAPAVSFERRRVSICSTIECIFDQCNSHVGSHVRLEAPQVGTNTIPANRDGTAAGKKMYTLRRVSIHIAASGRTSYGASGVLDTYRVFKINTLTTSRLWLRVQHPDRNRPILLETCSALFVFSTGPPLIDFRHQANRY